MKRETPMVDQGKVMAVVRASRAVHAAMLAQRRSLIRRRRPTRSPPLPLLCPPRRRLLKRERSRQMAATCASARPSEAQIAYIWWDVSLCPSVSETYRR
jgi:hypothetical protein